MDSTSEFAGAGGGVDGAGNKTDGLEFDQSSGETRGKIMGVLSTIGGMVVPPLTLQKGKVKLPLHRNVFIVLCLYTSHSFSAWGDRMWAFVVSLLLVSLYPGSLLLPGIQGFVVQLTVAIFGSLVGDLVDHYTRMKVIVSSLLVQNGLLTLSAVAMALMFRLDWTVCHHVVVFSVLTGVAILLTAGANLATVVNTISIEKDWVVVIADGNKDTLAVLNANMRRIDLCCKLLAPALTGVILQHTDEFYTTVVVAAWNIVSFFAELGLLCVVYNIVPSLAHKEFRDEVEDEDKDRGHLLEDLRDVDEGEEEEEEGDEASAVVVSKPQKRCYPESCLKLLSIFSTFKNGWRIYIRQEVALIGFSMASLYLTVLGFSGVTSAYLLTQGLGRDLIGVFQGVGAIFGVAGTIIYPFLRKKLGTIRSGLFGISTQLFFLIFCLVAVVIPASNVRSNRAVGYYSPDCSFGNSSMMEVNVSDITELPPLECATVSVTMSASMIVPTPTMSSVSEYHATTLPSPSPTPTCEPSARLDTGSNKLSLYLLLTGIVCCRLGLWMFDLAVQQLVQEKVVEQERGVVSGVMNAMNSVMDMMHYVLVIAAPRPENFNILTGISFSMVTLGWLLYCIYVRKARGHFFHFRDYSRAIKQRCHKRTASAPKEDSSDDNRGADGTDC